MKKLLGILFLATILLMGCVEEDVDTYDSYLQISNWSYSDNLDVSVDYDSTVLYPLEYVTYTIADIEEDDYENVNVSYSGRFVFDEDYSVQIDADETYTLDVFPNCGEIVVANLSNAFTITEVYLSPSSDTSWGNDDLAGTIAAGYNVTWKAEAGYWDIKLVDDYGDEFIALDNYLGTESTITYEYTGFRADKATGDTDAAKAKNAAKYAGERFGGRLEIVK